MSFPRRRLIATLTFAALVPRSILAQSKDDRRRAELRAHDEKGDFPLLVKQYDAINELILDHHPFDVVGWDGYFYPWAFNIHDFEPIVGRIHQPPPVHQTFQGDGFVICSFCPRPYDFDPRAIPAPYNHSNVDSDEVLFYASNAGPSGVTGLARIARAGYPDPFAWKKGHKYFDAASTAARPVWYSVDIEYVDRFASVIPLETLKRTRGLERMLVTQKGSRLSVQPVTKAEFAIVVRLGRTAPA